MSSKTKMISELGASELLLPRLINDALASNDRAKYFFTLVQMAKGHADQPEVEITNLKRERQASGVEDVKYDAVVEKSTKDADGKYHIPEVKDIFDEIVKGIKGMIAPFEAMSRMGGYEGIPDHIKYEERLKGLVEKAPSMKENLVPGTYIGAMTSGQRTTGDSLHIMVMDLHKELNGLQSKISKESIDGARVYGLQDHDRPIIKAFMRGVNNTAKLKFEHPGLGTTATRNGDILVIQNDIGTTDAHVLVVHVRDLTATVTYTDIHIQRLLFFHSLFDKWDVKWEDTRSKRTEALEDSDVYHLSIGVFTAKDKKGLEDYLAFLGSRIVFLIDWNRARKRLRNFVKKKDVIDILKWAADNDYGHMGFLKLGGEQFIYEAIELTAKAPLRYGEQLHEVLGKERALEFLKIVMKTTTEGLLEGRSEFLIRDEVRAELLNYFHTANQGLLEIAGAHAALVVEIATSVRDGLLKARAGGALDYLERNAKRAKKWEKKADSLVNKARTMEKRTQGAEVFVNLLRTSDDVADSLEEVAFLLTLVPADGWSGELFEPLQDLSELVVKGSREYLKAVENARHVQKGTSREEMQDFLQAVDHLITIEHETDDEHRKVKSAMTKTAKDFKQLHLFSETARNIEEAADALMRAGLMLRDYVLGEMVK
jgi:uncharacterized protein Yka (UPF0111/DUF47 family)